MMHTFLIIYRISNGIGKQFAFILNVQNSTSHLLFPINCERNLLEKLSI